MIRKEKKETHRKAVETFLSGKQISGKDTEKGMKTLSKEEIIKMEVLALPISTKDLKIRGRKKGIKTPRQTFRCDESLWRRFQASTRKRESKSASEVLRRLIQNYIGRGK